MEYYLAHHGIKGQRWGIRRYQNEDGSLTSEGREHYGYGDGRKSGMDIYDSSGKKSKGQFALSDKQKKYLKIGAAVAGAAVAAYGAYKFSQYMDITKSPRFDKATGLMKKRKGLLGDLGERILDQQSVNPFGLDPNDPFQEKWFMNCSKCSMTYEMRRRGFDVHAQEASFMSTKDIRKYFKNATEKTVMSDSAPDWLKKLSADDCSQFENFYKIHDLEYDISRKSKDLYKQLKKDKAQQILHTCEEMGPNARGHLTFFHDGGGHSIAWENDKNGITTFIDTQLANAAPTYARTKEGGAYFRNLLEETRPLMPAVVTRTDNATPNLDMMKDNILRNDSALFEKASATGLAVIGGLVTGKSIKSIYDQSKAEKENRKKK